MASLVRVTGDELPTVFSDTPVPVLVIKDSCTDWFCSAAPAESTTLKLSWDWVEPAEPVR